ncbi:MAG: cache domain-containing protein [Chloroflexi bacterium]|nr:cache domain-containing protein [Chloroflexota bacterium]
MGKRLRRTSTGEPPPESPSDDATPGPPVAAASRFRLRRPSPLITAICVVTAAAAFMAGLTYYGAQTFTRRAANTRASNEARSFSAHSAKLATGDAFDGYIQILRYSDDPIVSGKASSPADRVAVMQQQLYINVNKFVSLTVANRAGDVLASTDPNIKSVRDSQAFIETRSNLGPANSDVMLPIAGKHGYVEYSAPLREPDGAVWGVLIGRADPARLWTATLLASVDGSRNVIINSDGQFAAGVPDELLSQPWRGAFIGNGGVRADIAGVDSICGLAPIGKDTQIDRGLNVASCLPVSLIQLEHGRAMGKQGLITGAGAVLAIVLALGALNLLLRSGDPAPPVVAAPATGEAAAAEEEPKGGTAEAEAHADPIEEDVSGEPSAVPADAPPLMPPPAADVDALTLIDAYEQRNARLSERIRESIQARLLVATSQVDEAYKLAATDLQAAASLHAHAMEELDEIRDRDLRAIGQELHPGLVRLGLPAALKVLRKELAGQIDLTIDVDATADSLGGAPGRASVPPAQRLVFYRFALEAARALAAGGAATCTAALKREGDALVLSISGMTPEGEAGQVDRGPLAASALAFEAYAGFISVSRREGVVTVAAEVPALPIVEMAEGEAYAGEDGFANDEEDLDLDEPADGPGAAIGNDVDGEEEDEEDIGGDEELAPANPPVIQFVKLPPEDDGAPALPDEEPSPTAGSVDLPAAIEALRESSTGAMEISADIDLPGGSESLPPALRSSMLGLMEATVASLRAAGAARCALSLHHASGYLLLSAVSETDGTPFDASLLELYEAEIETFGGHVAVTRRDNAVSVTAEIAVPAADSPADPADFAERLKDAPTSGPAGTSTDAA